ncbi:hypothetical protein [Jiangella rhizosphaerae]|uniref:hypothetical protein n=1 Tax=Jiangella rhizosphaerae TaxID=2293569 RepID=UPI0011C430AE|nr:hypothetical protein [Jiangella rhizosphaerae]
MDEQALEAATAGLEQIREQLRAAAQGETDAHEVADAVGVYWRDHEDVLRAAAASLTEEVRLQALGELYRWREQLDAQLRRGTASEPAEGTGRADEPPDDARRPPG